MGFGFYGFWRLWILEFISVGVYGFWSLWIYDFGLLDLWAIGFIGFMCY